MKNAGCQTVVDGLLEYRLIKPDRLIQINRNV
jgi:hypothetical protein